MMVDRLSQIFFLPSVVFGFAFLTSHYLTNLPEDLAVIIPLVPYLILGLVMLLAATFNRGRTLLASGIVILLALSSKFTGLFPHMSSLLLLLIPLNLGLIIMIPERGSFTRAGILRLALLIAQLVGLIYFLPDYSAKVEPFLFFKILPGSLWSENLPTSQIAFFVTMMSFAGSFVFSLRQDTPITNSLFSTQLGCCFLLLAPVPNEMTQIFLLAIGILLANGLLRDYYNMAYRDELTGLPQRRALNEELQSLGSQYSLAMMDVDHFKKFNDTHGHDVGDQVLQMVASQIRKVQGGGKAYRFGGEEFTVVFANRSAEDAAYFLEIIRKAISNYEMVIRENERVSEVEKQEKQEKQQRKRGAHRIAGKKVSVTISIGVAEKSQRGEQPEDILKRADEALYRAKNSGRNALAF